MATVRVAAVAAHFRRDLAFDFARIDAILADARQRGAELVVLPDAALGGYLTNLDGSPGVGIPPALDPDGADIRQLVTLAANLVICVGYREAAGPAHAYNSAVCVSGDGVLGRHRKVHQPAGERGVYLPGVRFGAFDTPVGRIGMMIDYDKTFPESARSLAADGARILACLSVWPASRTNRAPRLAQDRQTRLFDLYDQARAAENQVFVVSSNQTGISGHLRFLGQAKVVGPGGEILARTGAKAGLAVADIDPEAGIDRARKVFNHLAELRPNAYRAS